MGSGTLIVVVGKWCLGSGGHRVVSCLHPRYSGNGHSEQPSLKNLDGICSLKYVQYVQQVMNKICSTGITLKCDVSLNIC